MESLTEQWSRLLLTPSDFRHARGPVRSDFMTPLLSPDSRWVAVAGAGGCGSPELNGRFAAWCRITAGGD